MASTRNQVVDLLPLTVITTAGTVVGASFQLIEAQYLLTCADFVYGTGGTTTKVYVQTSVNGGDWRDIMSFAFALASRRVRSGVQCYPSTALAAVIADSDAALTDDTVLNGFLGDLYRVKYVSVGTYATNTTLRVTAVAKS